VAEDAVADPIVIVLVRNGTQTDYDMQDPDTGVKPWVYPVLERVYWTQTESTLYGVSLAAYGQSGLWRFSGAEYPLQDALNAPKPVDYYNRPYYQGATAFEPPHPEAP
jgi:hypothetical protein